MEIPMKGRMEQNISPEIYKELFNILLTLQNEQRKTSCWFKKLHLLCLQVGIFFGGTFIHK